MAGGLWVITEHCIASGCTLLFYETYGKKLSGEREPSPRYALLVNDGIVQPVPEHPKREHVFCVSNSHGDVYLFQVSGPTTRSDCKFPDNSNIVVKLQLFLFTCCFYGFNVVLNANFSYIRC